MPLQVLGNGNTTGSSLGSSGTSLISVYGATPAVQRTASVLATSASSASSFVTVGSNLGPIVIELIAAIRQFGLIP